MRKFSSTEQAKVKNLFESIKQGRFTRHDLATVLNNIPSILSKSTTGPLGSFFDDIKAMCDMVGAWTRKEYKQIPYKSIGVIVLTLVYVFTPIDIIPDFIPGVGLLDDATMVGLCLKIIKEDIEAYKLWSRNRTALLK